MNYDPHAPNPDEQLSPEELAARKGSGSQAPVCQGLADRDAQDSGGEALKTEYGPYYARGGRDLGRGFRCFGRMGHSAECSPIFATACDAPCQTRNDAY